MCVCVGAGVDTERGGLRRHADAPEFAHVVRGLTQGGNGLLLPVVAGGRGDVHASTCGAGVAGGGAVGVGDEAAGADDGQHTHIYTS